jgi:hypothetical protein
LYFIGSFSSVTDVFLPDLIILIEARIITMAKSNIKAIGFVMTKEPKENNCLGIRGTNHSLVAYTAAIEGIPKIRTVLKSTLF